MNNNNDENKYSQVRTIIPKAAFDKLRESDWLEVFRLKMEASPDETTKEDIDNDFIVVKIYAHDLGKTVFQASLVKCLCFALTHHAGRYFSTKPTKKP
jgi:hypothetical protein